jgi:hypothetical protein
MSTTTAPTYPARVEGRLDPGLSRWLWLVKWLLVIPHYIVLAFLWLAFFALSVVAFFAIVFTGRYPRGIFDFNVGVLRWSWRVAFYAFGANGTDRYPPFTLADADYPARFEVEYPEQLSRGLVLVKWWLLAIPHYIVVAIFIGGGSWAIWQTGDDAIRYGGGLVGVLVFIAVVVLLFTGRYPRGIFDLVLGMDRWALRVAAYAGLMTDRYPPFRLDLGGDEPGSLPVHDDPPAESAPAGWTAGRIAAVIAGSLLALIAAGVLSAGVAGVVLDQTSRDDQGFVMSDDHAYATGGYAIVSGATHIDLNGGGEVLDDLVGDVKARVDSPRAVFAGVGPAADVDAYLAGVPHQQLDDLGDEPGTLIRGSARPADPASQRFWVASTSGPGERSLRWNPRDGDWKAVVMDASGARGVRADVAVGAELPHLLGISLGVAGLGVLLLAAGGAILAFAVRGRKG